MFQHRLCYWAAKFQFSCIVTISNIYLDLYISYKNISNNEWSSSKLMSSSKTKTNEIGIGQSEDLEKIFFSDLSNKTRHERVVH